MSIQSKRRYRLLTLFVVAVTVIASGAGLYAWRINQLNRQALVMRAEGIAAFEAGDYFNALHKLGRYLQRYPDDAEVLYQYAQTRINVPEPGAKHLVQAMGILRRLSQLRPDHPTAKKDLLKLYIQTGFRSELLDVAEAILKDNPNDAEAVRAKIDVLINLREFDKALSFADEQLETNPESEAGRTKEVQVEAIRAKAIVLRAKQQLEQALVFAQQYNQNAPQDFDGHLLTFQLMRELQRPEVEMVERAQELRAGSPGDPSFELLQAIAYRITSDRKSAIQWLKKVASQKPTDEILIGRLASELDAVELFQDATSVLEVAAEQIQSVGLRRRLVYRLIQAGRLSRADEFLETLGLKAQSLKSDSELLGLHAFALDRLGRPEAASDIVEGLALRNDDRLAEAWVAFHRGVTFQDDPNPANVIEVCQAALHRHARNPFFLFTMGQAYALLGETDLALDAWRKASTYAPAWSRPLVEIARTLIKTEEQRPYAVSFAEAAFRRNPNNLHVASTLAVSVAANLDRLTDDKLNDLLTLVNEIQRATPGHEETLPIQILLLARTGQTLEAKKALQAALDAKDPPSLETLRRLTRVSQQSQLGLDEACLALAEKAYGLTPAMVLEQAIKLLRSGQPEQGLELLESEASNNDNTVDWKVAIARYLDLSQNPRAQAAWVALGDKMPDNLRMQQLAIQSRSAWQDLDFIDRTIERLRTMTGDDGIAWQTARARWIIRGSNGQEPLNKAVGLLSSVILRAPRSIESRRLLGQCYEMLGNHTGAIEQLTQAIRMNPNDLDVAINLARLHQSQGDHGNASVYLDHIAKAKGKATPGQIYRTAQLFANQSQVDSAIQLLEPLYEHNPNLDFVGVALAEFYQRNGDIEKVQHICEQLLQAPTAAAVRFAAHFYASQGRMELADETLVRLNDLQLQPGVREQITGDYLARYVSVAQAIETYKAAVQVAPNNTSLWRRLIAYQISLGQGDEAIRTTKQALKSIPDDETLAFLDRHASLVTSSSPNAILRPIVLSVLENNQTRAVAVEILQLFSEVNAGDVSTDETLSSLGRLAHSHTNFLPLQLLAAKIFSTAGRHEDAVLISTRAMQRFPNHQQSIQVAMEALAAAGRWDEALGVANKLREHIANNPIGADLMISEAKLRLGDVKGASEQLKPYLSRALDNPEIYAQVLVSYARALIAAGDTQQAADLLAPFLDQSPLWRGAWIRLAALAITEQAVAATWLEQVKSHIPADGMDEMVMLVQSWKMLSARTQTKEYGDRARHLIDQVIQHPAANARCWLLHGVMAEQGGQLETAEASYRKALTLDPEQHLAKNNLAMVLTTQHVHMDEAIELASQAVEALPRDPNYLDTLAFVHAKAQNYEAALASIRKAIMLDPANPQWQNRLATIQTEARDQ